jgi:hypothetical protein
VRGTRATQKKPLSGSRYIVRYLMATRDHFRSAVASGKLKIESINTEDKQADIGTKPLAKDHFMKLRKEIMDW